ncbi:MAG: PAS domain S-box protein [Methanosarcina sp.]
MEENPAKSEIEIIGDISQKAHFCEFYQTEEDLRNTFLSYFKKGLENSEFCIWVTSNLPEVEEAKKTLKKTVPELEACIKKGQIEIISYENWHTKDGIFDPRKILKNILKKADKALAKGYSGMRLAENSRWIKEPDQGGNFTKEFFNYQEKLDLLIKTHPDFKLTALCAYPLEKYDISEIIVIATRYEFSLIKREGKIEKIENFGQKKAQTQAHEELLQVRKTLERDQVLFDSINEGFAHYKAIYNEKGILFDLLVLKINNAGAELSGVKREAQVGKTWREIWPEVEDYWFETYKKVDLTGKSTQYENFSHITGRWYSVQIDRIEKGQFAVTFRDITERKEMEIILRENQNRLSDLLSSIQDGFLEINRDWRLTYVNQRAAENVSLQPADLIGLNIWEEFPYVIGSKFEKVYRRVMETREPAQFEIKSFLRDIWYEISVYPSTSGISVFWKDITARKSAEEALLENKARFEVIIANSPDIIFEQDRDLRYTWIFNPASPYTESDVLGKTDAELLPPDQAELLTSIKRRVLETGRREEAVLFLSHQGKSGWFEAIYEPRYDTTGQITGILSYSRDITERKKAEETLSKSEEKYRLLFTNMTEAFFLAEIMRDENGRPYDYRFLEVNPAFEFHTGVKRESVLGKSHLEIFHKADPEVIEKYGEVTLSGKPKHFEFFSGVTDKYIDIYVFSPEKGKFAAIFRDITERKRAEEALRESETKYRDIVETAQEGIWLIDADDRTVFINPKISEMLGYSIEEILGQSPQKFMALEFRASAGGRLNEHIQGVNHVIDHHFIRKDGSDLWCILSSRPLFDSKGKYTGSLAMVTDITERKQMEEKTRQRAEEMEAVMEVAPVAILIGHDPKSNNITGNQMANEFYEVETGENISASATPLRRIFHEGRELAANELPMQQAAFKDIKVRNAELNILMPSKEWKTFLGSASPLHDADGNVRGSIGAFMDITERKEAEAILRETLDNLENRVKERTSELQEAYSLIKENERRLAEAQKLAHIGSWDWNILTDELHWSDEVYRIFGYQPQEFKANLDLFLNFIHPEDREYVDQAIKKALDGKTYSIYCRVRLPDGRERIVHEQGEVLFDEKHIPVRMSGTIQDITERKKIELALEESEERYRSFIHNFNGIAFQLNEKLDLDFMKGNVEEITGYTEEEITSQNLWRKIIEPEDLPLFLKKAREMKFASFEHSLEFDYRIRDKENKVKWLHQSYQKLPGKNEEPDKYQGVIYDITEKKNAEKIFLKAEAARKKEIHHRIKNNLQVISSLLDLQAEKFRNGEYVRNSDVLEAFEESQDRVLSIALIHEELHEGKGTDKLNFSPYLEKLVENLFETYRVENIDIYLNLEIEENIFFDMDTAVPLGLIVNEIVSNSLKYAFKGRDKGRIRIKLCRAESQGFVNSRMEDSQTYGNNFLLQVSDDGIGIPEDVSPEDSETLGLQLISILLEQLEGELELKRDCGTEYLIQFKVRETS